MHRFLVWFSLITLDHVPQSLLARLTLHSYAFCDSAEVWVFIVG
ncbi:OpgC domain-containing protein [Paraburkholderia sediminicola]